MKSLMRKNDLKEVNYQLLDAIERTNDAILKENSYNSLKSSIDSMLPSLLERNGTQIPPRWTLPEITTEVLGGTGDSIHTQFSHIVLVYKDLLATPTNTSWFLTDTINFINQIWGAGG